jgi:hypothetical protein
MKKILLLALSVVTVSCGGGGGDSSACSALKVAGGESCNDGLASVAFLEIETGGRTVTCTGSYISLTAVLTAKHCFPGRVSAVSVASKGYVRRGSQVILHPILDLAIIKVSEPIGAAPVPVFLFDQPPAIGDEVIGYGYGADENGSGAQDRVANGEADLKATSLSFAGTVPGLQYVTVSNGSGNLCKGDSGGPVVAKNAAGRYGIIAVTSRSPYVSDEQPCVPIEEGFEVVEASVQNALATEFILGKVPDVSVE